MSKQSTGCVAKKKKRFFYMILNFVLWELYTFCFCVVFFMLFHFDVIGIIWERTAQYTLSHRLVKNAMDSELHKKPLTKWTK